MTTAGDLLRLGRDAQAVALAGENVKLAKKSLSKKKAPSLKETVRTGMKNIVGINLIRVQAQMASGV